MKPRARDEKRQLSATHGRYESRWHYTAAAHHWLGRDEGLHERFDFSMQQLSLTVVMWGDITPLQNNNVNDGSRVQKRKFDTKKKLAVTVSGHGGSAA